MDQSPDTQSESTAASAKTKSSFIKDFSIPISIIIAGALVGAGIYFGTAGQAQPYAAGTAGTPTAPAQQTTFQELVIATGIDEDAFVQCFESGETADIVQAHYENAAATGGRGTPWGVVVGPSGKKYPLNGAVPRATIDQIIDLALSEGDQPSDPTVEGDLANLDPVTESDHIKGDFNAPVKIVEYSDFDCPFCGRFHATMIEVVQDRPQDVAWIYRHFPLDQLHPNARAISVASECIAKLEGEEAFWQFTDAYFLN